MAHTIFVYGTLKRGGINHHLMAGQRFRGMVVTAPKYRVVDLGPHPGLIRDTADGLSVHGELWDVDDLTLAALDEFEGIPGDFVREAVKVAGVTEVVEAYLWTRGVPPGAPTGDRWPRG